MKNTIVTLTIIAIIALAAGSCKKDNNNNNNTPFTADTSLVEVNDSLLIDYSFSPGSMAFDPSDNSIYFYMKYNSDQTGFQILKYNIATKSLISVYINGDNTWANSNGSEGKRLFIRSNELWVPGGATNGKLVQLNIGNNTLTLQNIYNVESIDFGGETGRNPYDLTEANGHIYVLSMSDYVFWGNFSGTISDTGYFATGQTSHGSSIIKVSINNEDNLLVKCSDDSKIELRKTEGTFIRSVAINPSNNSQLVKDSKQRVYLYDAATQKIIRYSADLLVKEEFPALNFNEYYGIALQEDNQKVTLYCYYNRGMGMIRLPF